MFKTASKTGAGLLTPRSEDPTHITSREFAEACASERAQQLFARKIPSSLALVFYHLDDAKLRVICSSNQIIRQWSQLKELDSGPAAPPI